MPYVENRELVDKHGPGTVGELTYVLTQACIDYLNTGRVLRYQDYAEVIAALECAKLETYRRAVAKYEDKAIRRNGDLEWPA